MRTELEVLKMGCNACVEKVRKALEALPGVKAASVDLEGKRATVEHDEGVAPETLARAVTDAGYPASVLSR